MAKWGWPLALRPHRFRRLWVYDILHFVETSLILFGLGGPDCFNVNLSELDRRLKGTSFRDTTELHFTVANWKVVCDLIKDAPSLSLLSYV